MINADTFTATAHPAVGAPFDLVPVDNGLTLDEAWSPYGQATLTVVTPALADFNRLNPKAAPVRITLTGLIQPEGEAPSVITADLVLRDRTRGQRTGETVLDLHTDESLLVDYPLVATAAENVGLEYGTSGRALAGAVLAKLGFSIPDGLTRADLFSKNLHPNPHAETVDEVALATNLHTNPTPSTTLNKWTTATANGTLARSSTFRHGPWSNASGRVTAGGAATAVGVYFDSATTGGSIPVVAGKVYQFSVYIRAAATSRNWSPRMRFFDAAGVQVGADLLGPNVAAPSGTWSRAFTAQTAPAGAVSMAPWILSTTGVSSAEVHYFDDVLVFGPWSPDEYPGLSAAPFPHFDGNYTGILGATGSDAVTSRWTGPAEASTSEVVVQRPRRMKTASAGATGYFALASQTTAPISGIRSARLIVAYLVAAPSAGGGAFELDPVKVTPGYSFEASAKFRSNRKQTVFISPQFLDAAGVQIPVAGGPNPAAIVPANTVATISTRTIYGGPVTVPAGAVTARVFVQVGSGALVGDSTVWTLGDWFDLDEVMVTETPAPLAAITPYFDGSTADTVTDYYDWYGEAGDSVSVRNLKGTGMAAPDSGIWTPGQTAWDFLEPLIQYAGQRLWADVTRVWHLTALGAVLPGAVVLEEAENVYDYTDRTSRDGDWWDAVVIEYKWTDDDDVQHVVYDTAALPGFTKGELIQYPDTVYPGPGAAAGVLTRGLARARQFTVEAALDYDARPSMAATLTLDGVPESGKVSSITYGWPSASMTAVIDSEG